MAQRNIFSKRSTRRLKRAMSGMRGRKKAKRYPEPSGHRLRRYLGITALASSREDMVSWYRAIYTSASPDYMKMKDKKDLLALPENIKSLIMRSSSVSARKLAMKKWTYTGNPQQKIAKFLLQSNKDDSFARRPHEMRRKGNPPSKPQPNSSKGLVDVFVTGADKVNKDLKSLEKALDELYKTGDRKKKFSLGIKTTKIKY